MTIDQMSSSLDQWTNFLCGFEIHPYRRPICHMPHGSKWHFFLPFWPFWNTLRWQGLDARRLGPDVEEMLHLLVQEPPARGHLHHGKTGKMDRRGLMAKRRWGEKNKFSDCLAIGGHKVWRRGQRDHPTRTSTGRFGGASRSRFPMGITLWDRWPGLPPLTDSYVAGR